MKSENPTLDFVIELILMETMASDKSTGSKAESTMTKPYNRCQLTRWDEGLFNK